MAEESLRTDLLHTTTKDQNIRKEYLSNSSVLVHYRPPTRLHTNRKSPMKFPLYALRPRNWQRKGLPCVRHDAFWLWFYVSRSAWHCSTWSNGNFHRGKLSHQKSLHFFVSWMGYDESYDSWEPFANLRDSDHLHSYLREKNLTQLIPTKFR